MRTITILTVLATLLATGCIKNEGENNNYKITFLPSTSIDADGKSYATVTIDFDEVLHAEEEVEIFTTNGYLSALPLTGNDAKVSSLKIKPRSDKARVFLTSSREPDKDVRISIRVGDYLASKVIAFDHACPEEMLFVYPEIVASKDTLDRVTINLDLLRELGTPSDDTRISFSIESDTDTSATLFKLSNTTVFSDSGKITNTIQTLVPDSTGIGTLVVRLNEDKCDTLVPLRIPIRVN